MFTKKLRKRKTYTLLEALNDKRQRLSFEKYLEAEYSSENLQFWTACEHYKTLQPEDRHPQAEHIHDNFIRINCASQINLDGNRRQQITDVINREGDLPPGAFDSAQNYIYAIMESDSFPRFLQLANSKRNLFRRGVDKINCFVANLSQ